MIDTTDVEVKIYMLNDREKVAYVRATRSAALALIESLSQLLVENPNSDRLERQCVKGDITKFTIIIEEKTVGIETDTKIIN